MEHHPNNPFETKKRQKKKLVEGEKPTERKTKQIEQKSGSPAKHKFIEHVKK